MALWTYFFAVTTTQVLSFRIQARMMPPQYAIRSKDALPASLLSLTHRLEVEGQP